MADFKSTLLLSKVAKKAWWGKVDNFDTMEPPSPQTILQQAHADLLNQHVYSKCQEANNFLMQLRQVNPEQISAQVENAVDDAIGKKLVEKLNAGLNSSGANSSRIYQNWKGNAQRIETNIEQTTMLLKQYSSILGGGITEGQLQNITTALRQAYNTFLTGNFYGYIREKAELAEVEVEAIINANPNYTAVKTGAWIDQHGQQIIEDAFAFLSSDLKIPFSNGPVKIWGNLHGQTGQHKVSNITELLEVEGTVKLSDEAYAAIRQIKAFAVQVKSGIDQDILNKNKRNQVTLNQVGRLGEASSIYDMYMEDIEREDARWFKVKPGSSKSLNDFANAQLNLNLAKTNLALNEIYFTSIGFVTALEWFIKENKTLKFSQPVTYLSTDMMGIPRAIAFV